jgi:chromosomal replication initiation ATPase DnaA
VPRPSLRAIREIVCAAYGVEAAQIRSGDEAVRSTVARRTVAWLACCHAYDYREIGHHLRRDPTTVRDMIARVDKLIETDAIFADRMIGLAAAIDRANQRN